MAFNPGGMVTVGLIVASVAVWAWVIHLFATLV